MKMKIALATATLMLLPTLSMAAGCNYDKQAMSCAAGSTYDSATNTCLPVST